MDEVDVAKNRLLAALKPQYNDLLKLSNDMSLPTQARQCILYALGDLTLFNPTNNTQG